MLKKVKKLEWKTIDRNSPYYELKALGACDEALWWICTNGRYKKTYEELIYESPRPDWLIWLLTVQSNSWGWMKKIEVIDLVCDVVSRFALSNTIDSHCRPHSAVAISRISSRSYFDKNETYKAIDECIETAQQFAKYSLSDDCRSRFLIREALSTRNAALAAKDTLCFCYNLCQGHIKSASEFSSRAILSTRDACLSYKYDATREITDFIKNRIFIKPDLDFGKTQDDIMRMISTVEIRKDRAYHD